MHQVNSKKLLIAGGGTGGHVLAGIAVADAWKVHWGDLGQVFFVGAFGGLEEKLVPQAGYPLTLLKLGSLNRVSWKRKLKTLGQLPFCFFRCMRILLTLRPQTVLGVGGYASGPVVWVARFLRFFRLIKVHIAILEQNAVPGLTNRLLGFSVDIVLAGFPGLDCFFPKKRVIVTGNPIRNTLERMPISPVTQDKPFTVFIFGGSQGSFGMNTLVLEALEHLGELRGSLQWIHQTGEKDFNRVLEGYKKARIQARVEKFIQDMPQMYRECHLVICRAGASTLAEIATVGRAAILIPLPTAANNHQEENARVYSDAGAAHLLLQEKASGQQLALLMKDLVSHPQKREKMEQKLSVFQNSDAAMNVVNALSLVL